MGMSASQARFLCLTARKNNVEFEGQQINQQRTTLSNESGSYYSELCNMVVPVPPSVDNYTKITYTFDDGALNNTVTSMIAVKNGTYSISFIQQWQDDYSIVSAASSIIMKDANNDYKIGSVTLRKLGDVANMNWTNDPYLKTLSQDKDEEDVIQQEQYYRTMLNEEYSLDSNTDWYVRYVKNSTTGSYVPYFYEAQKVEDCDYVDGYGTNNVDCATLGSAIRTREVLAKEGIVEKDSTGRYISITFFQTDAAGNVIKDANNNPIPEASSYSLVTNTVTDEEAYNDALNKYNYEQYQYEQKIQEINSKIEILQQQDKKLELDLKSLDTEEQALNNEIEAVKNVIKKNVDTTFKTFSA